MVVEVEDMGEEEAEEEEEMEGLEAAGVALALVVAITGEDVCSFELSVEMFCYRCTPMLRSDRCT